ncbi:hypothetical protein Taro_023519, partial [Colocasia esculenta]|nr:hypothetical protein [Colocasia esculenta]
QELGINALDAEIPGVRPAILPSTPGTARDRRQVGVAERRPVRTSRDVTCGRSSRPRHRKVLYFPHIPTAGQEESVVPDTAATSSSRQYSSTFCTFPWCEERVSPLWEDTWWFRVLDDYGQVLEVRKQRPQDQGLPKTSAGSPARSASPSSSSSSGASYRKTRKASSPSSSVVGDETLVEETLETDFEHGD